MRRALLALLAVAVLAPAAQAATPTRPVYDSQGRLVQAPFAPVVEPARLTEQRATALFLAHEKVADWLDRYPRQGRVTDATFDKERRDWEVGVWWSDAGQIATGRVDDGSGEVTEAWTGPQVAWKMARGGEGAFGGTQINSLPIWLGFCVIFLLGLADLRRPLSVRNLDLLVLLSFSVSLWFFNEGDIFTSVPLAYPPMLYLLGRMVWATWRGGPGASRAVWPVWMLAAATVFLTGFRIGLNVRDSNVIDVGYSGVIGAHRIVHGESPYGHMPRQGDLKACGPADAAGEIRERVQTNGRCESANERGDTYGPVAYEAYIPGYALFGLDRKVGRPARVARDRDRLRPARAPRPVPARAPLRGRAARRAAPVRVGRLSLHPVRLELEHERRDHARAPRVRFLVRHDAVRARGVPRAGRVDEVRRPCGRSVVGWISGGALAP